MLQGHERGKYSIKVKEVMDYSLRAAGRAFCEDLQPIRGGFASDI